MTDIYNRRRSALQFETIMKQKKQLVDSGYARSAKPLKRQAQPNQDIGVQFQVPRISDVESSQYKDSTIESSIIDICILSEFAIPSRSGMRLKEETNLTSTSQMAGGGFKVPLSVLLERNGVSAAASKTASGNISITALENADGQVTQLRLMASPDTTFLNTGGLELIIEDSTGAQLIARFVPPERSLMLFPHKLCGPAADLRLKCAPFHA